MPDAAPAALLVIDVQRAFEDTEYWGRRNNPDCEANVAALVGAWGERGHPVILVRHDSTEPASPLRRGTPGNEFQSVLDGVRPALLVAKSTNSAFYGSPDLRDWLTRRGISDLVLCGITTNHCVETTARMAGNLGYDVTFVLDATHTFDRVGPDGRTVSAEDLTRATAASLHGEFATVVSTAAIIGERVAA